MKIVKREYGQLDPKYKNRPFSKDTIDALYERYLVVLGAKRVPKPPRTPPTEAELSSFALDIESISQLPEEDRMDALRDAFWYFENNVTPPGLLTGDDAIQAILEEKNREDVTLDLTHLPPTSQAEFDQLVSELFGPVRLLDESEKKKISKVSRQTLRKCLERLGVKGKR